MNYEIVGVVNYNQTAAVEQVGEHTRFCQTKLIYMS